MKRIIVVLLAVFMMLACFGCSKEEEPVDETPLIEELKQIKPTTIGFYGNNSKESIEDYENAEIGRASCRERV